MKLKYKISVSGTILSQCPECGAWHPKDYGLCFDCYAKQPLTIKKRYQKKN